MRAYLGGFQLAPWQYSAGFGSCELLYGWVVVGVCIREPFYKLSITA